MTNSKRGMIPPYLIFCLFFVSRIVVTLTYVQGVSVGKFGADMLISVGVSLVVLLLFSLPVYFCLKKGKSPLDSRALSVLYSVYFCFFAALSISRFAYFSSSKMNTELSMVVVIILVALASIYGAYLGIESIARFGFVCAILLVLTLVAVLGLNIHNFYEVNLYPLSVNSRLDVVKNSILFTCNSVAPAYLLALSPRVNGNFAKPYIYALASSYCAIFLLVLFCLGVMGSSADLQAYPMYALFQLASIGAFARLDMLHTAFWILAVLLKTAILIYCASITIKRFTHGKKCLFFGALSGLLAIIINEAIGTRMVTPAKLVSIGAFVVFCVLLPLVSLIFGRKNEKN